VSTVRFTSLKSPSVPARGPPAWDDDLGPMPDWDCLGQPEPDVEFDQHIAW
jgi:hypothetical protein